MEVLHPQFRDRTMALEQLGEQYRLAKEKLPQAANQVYALETPVVNDAFRPDPPDAPALPPRLYYALHKAKVGARLLEQDRKEAQTSGYQVNWSYGRLDDAAAEVLRHIGYAQQRGLTHSTGLADSMTLPRRLIDVHQVVLQSRGEANAKVERRECEQHMQENELFLDVVAPVLEAENRIEQDTLRTALFDRDEDGERSVYQNIPSHRLTEAQIDADLGDYQWFKIEEKTQETLLEHVAVIRRQEWRAFWTANPGAKTGPSDERYDEHRIVAEEMLNEVSQYLIKLRLLMTDEAGIAKGHDFVDEDTDRQSGSMSPHRPAEILARFEGRHRRAVSKWCDEVADPSATGEGRGPLDTWPARPIEIDEERIWNIDFLPESDIWVHSQLVERHKVVCDETRRGLMMLNRWPSPAQILKRMYANPTLLAFSNTRRTSDLLGAPGEHAANNNSVSGSVNSQCARSMDQHAFCALATQSRG
ncbi:hypothetical protein LTR53_001219 [Teratosphaeriaceae sp. CCFEE 6253]|nr:hypothetical protein LTR53_001219 [Teratosphaeriaceae sp. CCFEE 6253]